MRISCYKFSCSWLKFLSQVTNTPLPNLTVHPLSSFLTTPSLLLLYASSTLSISILSPFYNLNPLFHYETETPGILNVNLPSYKNNRLQNNYIVHVSKVIIHIPHTPEKFPPLSLQTHSLYISMRLAMYQNPVSCPSCFFVSPW